MGGGREGGQHSEAFVNQGQGQEGGRCGRGGDREREKYHASLPQLGDENRNCVKFSCIALV